MAYSPQDLREIRRAERLFWEQAFTNLYVSVAMYGLFRNCPDLNDVTARGNWLTDRANRSLDRWRAYFCPSRAGLPIESEWTEV